MKTKRLKAAPSKEAVVKFLNKEPNGGKEMISSFLLRSVLIVMGILAVGDSKNIVRNSLASSLAIQVYLLWFYNQQLKNL